MSADGTFVSELENRMRKPVVIGVNNEYRTYLPTGWIEAPPTPLHQIRTLNISTLTSMRDYLKSNIDEWPMDGLIIHVATPVHVALIGQLASEEMHFRRHTIIVSDCDTNSFRFNEYMSVESLTIGVMTQFVDTAERAAMLKLVASVKDVEELAADDDGVSQDVTARAGAAFVQRFAIKNPVMLAPYRCFREVDQPASPFVLRLKRVKDQLPQCALFECDGGQWRLDAIEGIREWFTRELPDVAVIA